MTVAHKHEDKMPKIMPIALSIVRELDAPPPSCEPILLSEFFPELEAASHKKSDSDDEGN